MASKGTFGRVVVLLILILLMVFGGLWWFNYLGIIRTGGLFAPLYRLIGREVAVSGGDTVFAPADLDGDRLATRLESLEMQSQELDKRSSDLDTRASDIDRMAQELEERRIALEEKEKTFNETVKQYENRKANIDQNARYLTGMPPKNAVEILLKMDDQDIIDTLRTVEEIARTEGAASMVSFWMSLMPPERAAILQRKMASKPSALE